jgi:hypothetical protein
MTSVTNNLTIGKESKTVAREKGQYYSDRITLLH